MNGEGEAIMSDATPLEPALPPSGVRARIIGGINGLSVHVLEAGGPERPLVLLLHGFPELAYSWRRVLPALADAGFHVVAPDQRGYGRTTGWDASYDGDVDSFRLLNLVRDVLALVAALGHRTVAAVVGHDFGSPVAACCALIRPDVFRAVALMSAPFDGPPALPFGTATRAAEPPPAAEDIHDALARLDPPRKHYHWYYSTRQADADMVRAPQGLHAFLRAYFHMKSADWPDNRPHRLRAWSAEELAQLPTYYIMERDKTMPESVAAAMPSAAAIAACRWLPDSELALYAAEFARTGFQGGLQWYRCRTEGRNADLDLFSGRTIDVPAIFIAGKSDWGVFQMPGSFERMQTRACTRMLGAHLLEGAGHWAQQEQPERVTALLLELLRQGSV
jgi:pimeloyl-ACP methyl ester carboxylesterase